MNKQRLVMLMVVVALAAFLTGCGKTQEIASPTCAELEKVSDQKQKAELLKKCPRLGPEFKASPKIGY